MLRSRREGDGKAPATKQASGHAAMGHTQHNPTSSHANRQQRPSNVRTSNRNPAGPQARQQEPAAQAANKEGGAPLPALPREGQRAIAGEPGTATKGFKGFTSRPGGQKTRLSGCRRTAKPGTRRPLPDGRPPPSRPPGKHVQHPRLSPPSGALNWAPPCSQAAHPPPPLAACGGAPIKLHFGALNWAPSAGRRPQTCADPAVAPPSRPTWRPSTGPRQQGDAHRRVRPGPARAKRQAAHAPPGRYAFTQPPADQQA